MDSVERLAEALQKSPLDLTPEDVEVVVLHFRSQYATSVNVTEGKVKTDKVRTAVKKRGPKVTMDDAALRALVAASLPADDTNE